MTLNFLSEKKYVLVFALLATAFVIYFGSVPMFWDMSYVSRVATHIYDANFSSLIFPEFDNGSPPLYSMYFALVWKIFGRNLWVSHLAVLPFVIILFYQFQLLLNRYVKKEFHLLAFIILAIEPALSTQILYSGYDVAIASFVLLGINAVLSGNSKLLLVSVLIIPLLSPRGFSFVAALFAIHAFLNFKKPFQIRSFWQFLLPYSFSFAIFGIWLVYHYSKSGWWMVSEENSYILEPGNGEWILRNLLYVFWKIMDSGRAFLFLFIAMILLKTLKIPAVEKTHKTLVFIIFWLILSYLIFFGFIHSLVSQRHFIPVYIFGIVLFVALMPYLKERLARMLSIMVVIAMFSGNLWTYPERFGNAWDASLKSLPYFALSEQLHDFIVENKIIPSEIGAEFPMNFDRKYTHLDSESFAFTDIDKKPIKAFKYIVHSNISNAFDGDIQDTIQKKWILLKQFPGTIVYIRLYKNPEIP